VHVVEGPDSVTGPTPGDGGLTADVVGSLDRKQLAREMLSGLLHLHSLKVTPPSPFPVSSSCPSTPSGYIAWLSTLAFSSEPNQKLTLMLACGLFILLRPL
jgi:hypothetical protein